MLNDEGRDSLGSWVGKALGRLRTLGGFGGLRKPKEYRELYGLKGARALLREFCDLSTVGAQICPRALVGLEIC